MERMMRSSSSNFNTWLKMFEDTMQYGLQSKPRDEIISEMEDYKITINPMYPFMCFKHRNIKPDYFKKEMIWKLGANPHDESIKEHAKMWSFVQNKDGSFNSNYGQYWFGSQRGIYVAFNELVRDMDSRRAIIPMLNDSHIGPHVTDTVCTEAVGFRIRNAELNMSVHMRSSDQIFGLGTDIPTFAFLQRIMLGMLQSVYPGLGLGTMTIVAMSSHIYQRHFDMVNNIINDPEVEEDFTRMPLATTHEAFKLAACAGNVEDWGELSKWLLE